MEEAGVWCGPETSTGPVLGRGPAGTEPAAPGRGCNTTLPGVDDDWMTTAAGESGSRRRSKTTRETGFGAGLNCATRTRSTTELLTASAERWARLITPSRSITKRRGSERAKVE